MNEPYAAILASTVLSFGCPRIIQACGSIGRAQFGHEGISTQIFDDMLSADYRRLRSFVRFAPNCPRCPDQSLLLIAAILDALCTRARMTETGWLAAAAFQSGSDSFLPIRPTCWVTRHTVRPIRKATGLEQGSEAGVKLTF